MKRQNEDIMVSKLTGVTSTTFQAHYPFLSHLRYTVFILWEETKKKENHIHHSFQEIALEILSACGYISSVTAGCVGGAHQVCQFPKRNLGLLNCYSTSQLCGGSVAPVYALGWRRGGVHAEGGKHLRTHAWILWRPPVCKPLM